MCVRVWQSEEIFLDMFEDEYREMMVSYVAVCIKCLAFLLVDVLAKATFSSDRQHLSYDGCLEVRGEIIRTVLCCIVY